MSADKRRWSKAKKVFSTTPWPHMEWKYETDMHDLSLLAAENREARLLARLERIEATPGGIGGWAWRRTYRRWVIARDVRRLAEAIVTHRDAERSVQRCRDVGRDCAKEIDDVKQAERSVFLSRERLFLSASSASRR